MTERELSQKLEELAGKIEEVADSDDPNWFRELREIAKELRRLSNQKYVPGSVSWDDIKTTAKSTKNRFPF